MNTFKRLIFCLSMASPLFFSTSVHAFSGSDFQAGRIIDDQVFFDSNALSVSQIQTFLSSKVSTCDPNGTQIFTGYYNGTDSNGVNHSPFAGGHSYTSGDNIKRAQLDNRYPAPYTCLKDYLENPSTHENNIGRPTYQPAGGISAAQIIYNSATDPANRVNPKILMVLIQKESSLLNDDWPWPNEYKTATGYGCPDTAGCDANYFGLYNQVYNASHQFRYYANNPRPTDRYHLGTENVLYNPNSSCGTKAVNIQNQATLGLYLYTPYTPNQAALDNLYGTGDGCSAYGNRNFWRLYNDWFGSTLAVNSSSLAISAITLPTSTPAVGQTITYTASFTNTLSSAVTFDGIGMVGRAGSISGANRDFGWQGAVTLQAGATQQFAFTTTVRESGKLFMWPAIYFAGGYIQYNNWGNTVTPHPASLTLSQPLAINASAIYSGQDITFSAKVKNNEAVAIDYDAIGIPVKFYDRYNYDAAWVGPGTIAAGAELTLSGLRNIDKPGPYSYWVANYIGGVYSTIDSIKKLTATDPSPNFSVAGITFTNTTPVKGENLGATLNITNNLPVGIDVDGVGVVGRLGSFTGANRDIGWQGPIHFNAGETKTFTGYSRKITEIDTHYYWIGILYKGGYIQYNNWGSTIVSRAPNFSVSGLTLSSKTPAVGDTLTASFTVTNNLSGPIDVDLVGVVGRFGSVSGANRDIGWQGPIHFNAGEAKTFSGYSRTITDLGTSYYWIGILDEGAYIQFNNLGTTIVSH